MTVWTAVLAGVDVKKRQISFDLKSGEVVQGRFTVPKNGEIEPAPPAAARGLLLREAVSGWEQAGYPEMAATIRKMLAPD